MLIFVSSQHFCLRSYHFTWGLLFATVLPFVGVWAASQDLNYKKPLNVLAQTFLPILINLLHYCYCILSRLL